MVDDRHDALYRQDQAGGTERTGSQRAADALLDLVLDGVASPPGAKRPEPLIEIVLSEPPDHATRRIFAGPGRTRSTSGEPSTLQDQRQEGYSHEAST